MASTITKEQLASRITAAKLALDAVNAKMKELKIRTASAMKHPKLLDFQKAEGSLVVDGLYGNNSKEAITWYLQKYPTPQSIPAVNSRFANAATNWKPPALEVAPKPVPKPTPKPAPKPVAKKPVEKVSTKTVKVQDKPKPAETKIATKTTVVKSGGDDKNNQLINTKIPIKEADKLTLKPKTKVKVKVKKEEKKAAKKPAPKKAKKKAKDPAKVTSIKEESFFARNKGLIIGGTALAAVAAVALA